MLVNVLISVSELTPAIVIVFVLVSIELILQTLAVSALALKLLGISKSQAVERIIYNDPFAGMIQLHTVTPE